MAGGLRAPSADELETVAGQLNLTGTVAMAYPPPDRERDLRVAEADGRVAGSAVVQVVGSETVFANDGTEAFCRGHVVAEHRGQGIGAALLRWTLGRAAAEPGVREAWTQIRDPDGVALLEAARFRHDRTGQVMRNTDPGAVPEPDWPAGIRVDTSLRGERLVEAVTVACDRAFADLPRYRGASRANVTRLFAHPDADPTLCFLAVRDGEVVGLNFCLLERPEGSGEPRGVPRWIGRAARWRAGSTTSGWRRRRAASGSGGRCCSTGCGRWRGAGLARCCSGSTPRTSAPAGSTGRRGS
jgi:GNAT superfamily N-acetyltransferase